ncbi:hypothetical protein QZH41_014815 [Actinostola sp. cb2023]|nr:hypothetical protein QZH41_014815 [Actinostola sp. cb2023]
MYIVTILVLIAVGQLEEISSNPNESNYIFSATLQRDILTYINDLRHLHSSGPLISSPTTTAIAQKAAIKLAKNGDISAIYNTQFTTNHCVFTGRLSKLAQTCTVAWYTTMRDHSWCTPKADGKSRPFVNMIWNTTFRAGTGISKGSNGKYYVVTYFSPKQGPNVSANVHPVKRLHDRTNEGHFSWLDGLEFANGGCAPVSANGGNAQNCVAWTTNKPISCWSDKKCADRYPFMCRMPIEGKSTFRVEILFMKFRWNPNFRNQTSKAFRDLRRGLRVTFKEVLQRSSGRIGGGFRALKIKSVRYADVFKMCDFKDGTSQR